MVALAAVAGCAPDGPSADEERVCDSVQHMVDDLAAGRSQAATDELAELYEAVNATENGAMTSAGREFFELMFTDVDRFQMTVEQVVEVGSRFQTEFARSLDVIVAECRRVGSSIERLPA